MRRLCWFALGYTLAVLLFLLTAPGSLALILGAGLLLPAIGLYIWGRKALRRVVAVLLGLSLGFVWCFSYQALFLRELDTEERTVEAVAERFPTQSEYGWSVQARLKSGERFYRSIVYYDDETDIRPGDRLSCHASLTLAEEKHIEDNYFYSSRGIWLIASAKTAPKVVSSPGFRLRYLPAYASRALTESCRRVFPGDTAGLLLGLLLGERSGLSYAQKNALSVAGIYHTVAVSGMHVSILLGAVLLLCGSRRRLAALIGLPLVWFFVLMTGASASAVRAGVMQSLLLLAPLVGRENDMPTSLCTALLLLLLENPWSLRNVGLQLSFTSTAGIVLFASPLFRSLTEGRWFSRVRKCGRFATRVVMILLTAFVTSFAATSLSLPIVAVVFELFSLAAPLTNMLCLWAITLIFTLGMAACLVGLVCVPLASVLALPVRLLCGYVMGVVRLVADIPYAALYPTDGYSLAVGIALYACLLLVVFRPKLLHRPLWLLPLAASAAVGLGLGALDYRLPAFSFTALDVGQGQCLIYQSGSKTAVIDCGGYREQSGELAARYLQSRGVFRVEELILTHFDADHVNGVCQLLARERVETLRIPNVPDENGLYDAILDVADTVGTEVRFIDETTEFSFGNGTVTVFGPLPGKNSNETGLCVLASAEKYDILITGDLPEMAEYRFLSAYQPGDIDLLVAGHHGAATSTSEALLRQTQPETVVISVGKDNRYGHPADETLDRLAAFGAAVYRTDECGTLCVRFR